MSVGEDIQRNNFPTEESSDNVCSVLLDFQGKQLHSEFKSFVYFYLKVLIAYLKGPVLVGDIKYS